jgi:hypothetical protein
MKMDSVGTIRRRVNGNRVAQRVGVGKEWKELAVSRVLP